MNILTKRDPRIAYGIGAFAAALCAAWWFSPMHAHAAATQSGAAAVLVHDQGRVLVPEGSPLRRTLTIQPVAEQVIEVQFSLPAAVEADPAKLVKVLPPVAGRIASLEKRLGDAVKAGDVLFRIDSADVAQALSDADKARSALALARATMERQRALGAEDIAAAREVEQARADVEATSSELARANARLSQLGVIGTAGGTGASGVQGHLLPVRSPISGRVVDLAAANGAYWNDATAALMTVADLSTVFVTASADERDIGSLFVGQTAKVTLDAYPSEPFDGKVRYVGEIVDPDTRRVKIRLLFDNRDGRLKPGMFAKASFSAKAHRGVLVPASAVVQSGFYARVFVESQPWRFEPRVVKLGARVGESFEIVAGLKADERIVVKDGVLLND